ncbi:MAG: RidA family protein [Anaerolineales bacterium]|nr:RidA family protein [Anaerolineales bacterium]
MKEFRNPETIHPPLGLYQHQVELSASERFLIISGQVGMKPDGAVPSDPYQQLELALENILRNLEAADMAVKDLVKVNYYLVGEWDNAKRREIVAAKFGDCKPCSTLVYVVGLADPSYQVEIEAWSSRVG